MIGSSIDSSCELDANRGDAGSHGWSPAGTRELWTDITVVCPVLPTYVSAAAVTRGAAAANKAAQHKRNKYRTDIPVASLSFCRWLLKPRDTTRTT